MAYYVQFSFSEKFGKFYFQALWNILQVNDQKLDLLSWPWPLTFNLQARFIQRWLLNSIFQSVRIRFKSAKTPKSLFPLLSKIIVKKILQLFFEVTHKWLMSHNVERSRPITERGKIIKWPVHRRLINPYAVGIWNLLNATLIM